MIINLSHGNGGEETSELINSLFLRYFRRSCVNNADALLDSAVLKVSGNIAFTSDSFVIKPLFFKGGDIGKLSVCGTVNDLLCVGAMPKYLSASFIIEEGIEINTLEKIVCSMANTADKAGVCIVTGDTKVIEGQGGLIVSVSGIGEMISPLAFSGINEGDAIIVTGNLGEHHACVISERMGIENNILSDCAPLNDIALDLFKFNSKADTPCIKGIRDITRGGLATVLCEIADMCGLEAVIHETALPASEQVRGLCDILGLEPVYMANEGKFVIIAEENKAKEIFETVKNSEYGENAAIIGNFKKGKGVTLKTRIGGSRILGKLSGEGLPRIC